MNKKEIEKNRMISRKNKMNCMGINISKYITPKQKEDLK